MGWRGVGVEAEVADALELESVFKFGVRERRLKFGAGENLERVGVEIVEDVLAFFEVVRIALAKSLS